MRKQRKRRKHRQNYESEHSQRRSDVTIIKEHPEVAFISPSGEWVKARSERQKEYIEAIRKNDLTVCIGPAGTGKTFLPVAMALQALVKEETVTRIIITRPVVEAGEKLGFLPGDLQEKINPYLRPIHDAMHFMIGSHEVEDLISNSKIEIAPLAYMRGRTLENAFIILDEAQNTTVEQLEMLLTRMGNDSKVVVTGDITQIDLPKRKQSGLVKLKDIIGHLNGVNFFLFKDEDVVRHPLVKEIVKSYELWKLKNEQK